MDRFVRRFFGRSDVVGTSSLCVWSDKRGAHNLLKLHNYDCSSEVKDTIDVGVSIVEFITGLLALPRSYLRFIR